MRKEWIIDVIIECITDVRIQLIKDVKIEWITDVIQMERIKEVTVDNIIQM